MTGRGAGRATARDPEDAPVVRPAARDALRVEMLEKGLG